MVPGHVATKLHRGTWHAGPFFDTEDEIRFVNLELSDTNEVDHQNSNLVKRFGFACGSHRERRHTDRAARGTAGDLTPASAASP
jgi:hypothetical protein